jgi:hypothetical protein
MKPTLYENPVIFVVAVGKPEKLSDCSGWTTGRMIQSSIPEKG